MISAGERPRELRWYHAGPMLFGDWGTSRLYVLGLAFAFNGRASFWFILAMSVLLVGVGWSYEIICRLFPDGGGVYSSARHRSQLLAVIGGLLLCADYVVTASLSCLDAFHYLEATLGLHDFDVLGIPITAILAALTILAIGGLNYFGPTKTGAVAMYIAVGTVALTLIVAIRAVLHITGLWPVSDLGGVDVKAPDRGAWASWVGFTEIVLALSGVEAIANMTGIMVPPVEKTARKAIVPVLIEIVVLNIILAAAMSCLPDSTLYRPAGEGEANVAPHLAGAAPEGLVPAHTDDMLRVISEVYIGRVFATIASIVFATLLLSAVNTALADLVSIQFMLSRDRELPHLFAVLNHFGMPRLPLVVAALVPAVVVLLFPDVTSLAGLYAIGVVGAIAINLGTTSTNPDLLLRPWERGLMLVLTVVMIGIELTICVVKPDALHFALIVLVTGLAVRLGTIVTSRAVPIDRGARTSYLAFAGLSVALIVGLAAVLGRIDRPLAYFELPESGRVAFRVMDLASLLALGVAAAVAVANYRAQKYRVALLAHLEEAAKAAAPARPSMVQEGAYKPRARLMVATQGNPRLLKFALDECKSREAELLLLFVRHLAVMPMGPAPVTTLAEDEPARELFDRVRARAKEAGVPVRLLYGVARDIPDAILDMAVTYGADLLLLGSTRRGTLWKAMKGDVIQGIAEHLPESVGLLIHA